MTLTRHSLIKCRTKDCPFSPDEHDEWMELCSRAPEHGHRHDQPSHQHHPKKGMGGNNPLSKIEAILCWPMHDRIDNGDWGNAVKDMPGRGLVYFAWDIHGNTLIEREVLSDGAEAAKSGSIISISRGDEGEADPTLPRGSEGILEPESVATHTSAPSLSTKEESDGQDGTRGTGGLLEGEARGNTATESRAANRVEPDCGDGDRPVDGSGRSSAVRLTHEERVAIAEPELAEDWETLSDDQLQELYETAEKRQGLSFLVKCKAVHSFKEKHKEWLEPAYQRFGASRRTLYAYANIWAICVTSDTIERIAPLTDSKSLMQAIGRRSLEDGKTAMEAAVAHYAEFGEAPTVAALAHRLGVEAAESRERHSCPDCGAEHQVKK